MCVPALHISLGIFQRLFQLYEEACHELDVRLAATLTTSPEANQHFNDYVTALKKIADNEDMIRQCQGIAESNDQLAVWFALDAEYDSEVQEQVVQLLGEAHQLRQQADTLVSVLNAWVQIDIYMIYCHTFSIQRMEIQSVTPPEFSHHLGPFVQKVDKVLKECGVEQQAYFGGPFIGNHVHKCCKVN